MEAPKLNEQQENNDSKLNLVGKGSGLNSASEMFALIENCPMNIMYCDRDMIIQYLNPSSLRTLKQIENLLPVSADKVLGSSIDIFHKNPSYQQGILSDDKNLPVRSIISIGPEKLDLEINAIYDENKKYIGAMATWSVVTEKLKLENQAAQVQSMMENAPINVMMCDLDFNVNYINPKSYETLEKIQHLLPIPVDKIMGGSIDVFHKDPMVQRNILSNDKNLPHRANIKLGDETLDLLVSPIYNKDKEYIGPMVTWEVISEKVTLISTLDETAAQLGAASEELSATAGQMSKTAEATAEKSNLASKSAEVVAGGVQTVAANTEEMAASIKEIAKSSSEASEISRDALEQAQETNKTITALGEASQEIGNVIKVISSIAQQTNLLALNATIEAARAGDAGKGFAVVANEVKELAKQTASATEEITNKINNIQSSSEEAVGAIGGISKVIENINNISMTIAAAVEEQTATTNEVARVVQESNKGVESIASTVKEVATVAQESTTGANQTLEASAGLSQLAVKLRELVEKVQV